MDSVRAKHAAELEAKRKKLEEIRKRKASVRAAEEASALDSATKAAVDQQESKFDDFIQNILKTSGAEEAAAAEAAAETAAAVATPALSLAEKLASLSTMNGVAELHIQPILVETYTKHTETDITLEHEIIVREAGSGDMDVDAAPGSQSPVKVTSSGTDSSTSPSSPRRALAVDTNAALMEPDGAALSEEEKKRIMESDEMEAFLSKASRVIERALTSSSKFDIMIDYGATVEQDTLMEEVTESLKQQYAFTDDKWSKHRAVTDVDVSPFYPELTLVSYTARDFLDEEAGDVTGSRQWDTMGNSAASASALTDVSSVTDGVVLLWSTALPTRPEYRFTCHSQVTSAIFNPFDRHLIIGGTYSGQVVIWDTRAKSAPVRKTSLSASSHTHPIYSMAIIGSKSSYHLVSASTDGRVCVWDIDHLQQPIDMMDLRIALSIVSNYSSANVSDKKMEASVTSFAILGKEKQDLYIGTEAGKIYSTKLEKQKNKAAGGGPTAGDGPDASNDKANKNVLLGEDASVAREVIVTSASSPDEAHFGPITAMHFNPVLPAHHDGLLLTASLDSSVKLWSTEHPELPVLSFEPSSEYICDVRWSPVHPALFAVADGSGVISLWNILKDTEVPVVSTKAGHKALNKIRWNVDGKSIIIGDANGSALIFEVPSEVALPLPDDLTQLEAKVANAVLTSAAFAKP